MLSIYNFNAKLACRRGREHDNETGLYYYGARYFTPELSGKNSSESIKYHNMALKNKGLKERCCHEK